MGLKGGHHILVEVHILYTFIYIYIYTPTYIHTYIHTYIIHTRV